MKISHGSKQQAEAEAGQTGLLLLSNAFLRGQTHLVAVGGADRQGVANQQSHVVLLHYVNETKRNNDLQGQRENKLEVKLNHQSSSR